MTSKYFHFTLGPVQGFVAQARRTRDFWAGSFLLSWLSAAAMLEVKKQGGEIIFPKPNEDYLGWLEGKGSGSAPRQGCIPNRFKGGLAKVPLDFNPQRVSDSIKTAWLELAEAVWNYDLKSAPAATREIWDRQTKAFWEISWALSDSEAETNLLDRRKNWRNHLPSAEAGVKCMMMDGWQELSAIPAPQAKGLREFWDGVRKSGGSGIDSDLREGEYLCSIAFIKRRFARCFTHFKTQHMPGGWTLHGWEVSPAVPSVSYIAAAPWLGQVLIHAPASELKMFHDCAKRLTGSYGEYLTSLACINKAIKDRQDGQALWDTKRLDGSVFFESSLDNPNIYSNQSLAQDTKRALKVLSKSITAVKLEPVSPFYAILLMDGDSLGTHMSSLEKQQHISAALDNFTREVQAIVDQHSGFLIYAGGDDVLAMLPLEYALNCAKALRDHYLSCFEPWPDINTTLSGAIEYAHIRMPLGKVLSDAHRLLDDIAKEQTGRDAIAVRVWKPGGLHLQWAMPWEKAIDGKTGNVVIDQIAREFQAKQQDQSFTNSFFFNVEQRLAGLQGLNSQGEFSFGDSLDEDTLQHLVAAEYLSAGRPDERSEKSKPNLQEAMQLVAEILGQCFGVRRVTEGKSVRYESTRQFNPKALHLIRFLVQKGVEHVE